MSKFYHKLNPNYVPREAILSWSNVFSRKGFSSYGWWLFLAFCFFSPLSIAASQITVGMLALYWFISLYADSVGNTKQGLIKKRWQLIFARPLLCWLFTILIATLVGIDPVKAFPEFIKISFYLLLPFWISDLLVDQNNSERVVLNRIRIALLILISAQSIAAMHTIIQEGFMNFLPLSPPGPVTESGQLVLSLAAFIALALQKRPDNVINFKATSSYFNKSLMNSGIFIFAAVVFLAVVALWADAFNLTSLDRAGIVIKSLLISMILAAFSLYAFRLFFKREKINFSDQLTECFIWLAGALMISAMIINLKRGPWLGAFFLVIIIGAFFSRRLIILATTIGALSFISLEPVRLRVASLFDHFYIAGGRQTMWELAVELIQRYPLGLGLKNASYMQVLDPSLPAIHRHMHNNFLNILVETGWIGLSAYLWWMFIAISLGYVCYQRAKRTHINVKINNRAIIAFCLATGLLCWQIAGTVEYNFGDGEVRFIAMIFMGMILALLSTSKTSPKKIPRVEKIF